MIPKLAGYQINQSIYQGMRTLVYRGIRRSDSLQVAIKFLRNPYPSFNELVNFRNQYAIAKNINHPGIVVPLSLERCGKGYALVMPDLGAISLDKAIENHQSLDLECCLKIAMQLAETLQELDQQGVIHKDIKPANILIHPETQEVKLIDFSIASLLPKEAQEIKNFNLLEGTLAYISPEQTGRMNRGIDYRSDFYSLGATLYQLLTGVLPFNSDDPMELVHGHISQQPIAPAELKNKKSHIEIPPVVSDIVMKLMAKNAEDRYQSALGLKLDLEKGLKQWKETCKIQSFELGTRDIAGHFLIPEKLYGREAEVQTLLEVFLRVASGQEKRVANGDGELTRHSGGGESRVEMMLVAGFSGIGKTAVINEVHKPIVRQRGYFIKGKFNQFQRNIPFSAFVIAFRDLIEQLLSESDAHLTQWRDKILAALGENSQVIIDVVPELEQIIGKQPKVAELSGSEAQNRFNLLFQKFIQVFSTQEHPLVIFIDDLQWADSASLKLMQLLMGDRQMGYLLLLGAYRDNEVSPAHPLMLTLDEMGKSGATLNTITLAPLSQTDLNRLIADTLSCSQEVAWPLTELIDQKTKGNPFFATQFLKGLHEDGFISFNRELGYWLCDITTVRQLVLTDDVVEFMVTRLHQLPEVTQEILKLAACIGSHFNLKTLAIVSEQSRTEVARNLWVALQEGLVLPLEETYKFFYANQEEQTSSIDVSVDYKFLHDRIQQAAYSLIPDAQKQEKHLNIGRLLCKNTSEEEREERIFDTVNHLNAGRSLIVTLEERKQLCELNLQAGRKAKNATAYEVSNDYLLLGIELLPEQNWECEYELSLALYESAAESAYLVGNFEKMEQLADVGLKNARTLLEAIVIHEVKIQALQAQTLFREAIEAALLLLQALGVRQFPEYPGTSDTQLCLEEMQQNLGDRHPLDLLDSPPMSDPNMLAAMRILASIAGASYITNPMLFILMVFERARLSIDYGNSPYSDFAYAAMGLVLCGVFNNIELGYQFGELAIQLALKQTTPYSGRAIKVANAQVKHHKEPIRNTLEGLKTAYLMGLQSGDFEYVGYAALYYSSHCYLSGQELSALEGKLYNYSKALEEFKQKSSKNYIDIYRQAIHNLLKRSEHPCLLVGNAYDEAKMLPVHQEANDLTALYYIHLNRAILCYLFQDYDRSHESLSAAEPYSGGAVSTPLIPIFHFYRSLVTLAKIELQPELERQEQIEKIRGNQEILSKCAHHAPPNYSHKWHLVEAEKHRVLGNKTEAIELYDRAIAGAKDNEFLQEEALANELAAKFYLDWGKEKVASSYMTDAYYGYARWGAKAKIDQLEEKYPQLLASIFQQPRLHLESNQTATFTLTQTAGSSTSTPDLILDWATAMKASQSLSSEIHLDKLISTLMKAALENAGADSAILLLSQQEIWQVVARCLGTSCDFYSTEASYEGTLPTSVINKVKRSQKPIIVNDFSRDTQFTADPYLLQEQPKSFLCVPILNQGKPIGILYLENHLAVGAFTGDRVELLSMLCSQAAISLENARLYQQSQDYAQKLKGTVQELQQTQQQLQQSFEELKQAQLQLVQSEKMSALGNLVAGVAHEINNPVGFISGNIEPARDYVQDLLGLIDLYQQEYPQPSEAIEEELEAIDLEFVRSDLLELISSMRSGTDRIRHISTSLRTFTRTDKEYKVAFDIHQGIESTLLILKHRLKTNEERPAIEIIKDYGELPEVHCFPGQLNQVFMNLIANAIDALEEGNQGRSFEEIANQIKISTSATAQEVTIGIADNGMGMPEEVRERIFEQGFTTKAVGKGTGLGMAIAKSIVVQKHGGKITCTSQLGKGTELTLSIPVGK